MAGEVELVWRLESGLRAHELLRNMLHLVGSCVAIWS
jgi:hypothetical protein